MADASYAYKWLMVDTSDEQITHVYVWLEEKGDCPPGVQGWHYKAFPARMSTVDILTQEIAGAVLWPQHAPPWRWDQKAPL